MLADDLKAAEARAAALAAKPIAINSALDRKESAGPVTPTVNRAAPESPKRNEEDLAPWPDEAMEAAMSAEVAERDGPPKKPTKKQRERAETLDGGPLPPLDEMIKKIPADLQEKMDDLFRAKFQTVKRVPKSALNGDYVESPRTLT